MKKMTICLWFDTEAEEAAKYYCNVFNKNSKLGKMAHYEKESARMSRRPEGSVMSVDFEINGQKFMALNGGPEFTFNEAISLVVECDTQEEIDKYWKKLTEDGGEEIQCGWVKDKYGMSWQIVPSMLHDLITSPDRDKAGRVLQLVWKSVKLDVAALKAA